MNPAEWFSEEGADVTVVPANVSVSFNVNVLSAKLRNRNYIDKSGNHATWLEITVFEMEEYQEKPQPSTKFNKFKK